MSEFLEGGMGFPSCWSRISQPIQRRVQAKARASTWEQSHLSLYTLTMTRSYVNDNDFRSYYSGWLLAHSTYWCNILTKEETCRTWHTPHSHFNPLALKLKVPFCCGIRHRWNGVKWKSRIAENGSVVQFLSGNMWINKTSVTDAVVFLSQVCMEHLTARATGYK